MRFYYPVAHERHCEIILLSVHSVELSILLKEFV